MNVPAASAAGILLLLLLLLRKRIEGDEEEEARSERSNLSPSGLPIPLSPAATTCRTAGGRCMIFIHRHPHPHPSRTAPLPLSAPLSSHQHLQPPKPRIPRQQVPSTFTWDYYSLPVGARPAR